MNSLNTTHDAERDSFTVFSRMSQCFSCHSRVRLTHLKTFTNEVLENGDTKGVLDVIMSAYGRAYYVWVREGGTIVGYWYLADADGAFTFPDGRVVRSESMMCLLENMRTFQRRH